MRTFGFKLADVPPGDYEIVMAVRDDIAGRSFEISEPFKVTEPLPASALPPRAPRAATPRAAVHGSRPPGSPAGDPGRRLDARDLRALTGSKVTSPRGSRRERAPWPGPRRAPPGRRAR